MDLVIQLLSNLGIGLLVHLFLKKGNSKNKAFILTILLCIVVNLAFWFSGNRLSQIANNSIPQLIGSTLFFSAIGYYGVCFFFKSKFTNEE